MARTIYSGRLAYSQFDFFDGNNRKTGLTINDLQINSFVNGEALVWNLSDGLLINDLQINAGSFYFNEINGYPGFYVIKFFTDRTGFWRLVLKHPTLGEFINEFDVISPTPSVSGLRASFQP